MARYFCTSIQSFSGSLMDKPKRNSAPAYMTAYLLNFVTKIFIRGDPIYFLLPLLPHGLFLLKQGNYVWSTHPLIDVPSFEPGLK
eukprot:scaffold421985_cov63-Attheya_sp.AAC.3